MTAIFQPEPISNNPPYGGVRAKATTGLRRLAGKTAVILRGAKRSRRIHASQGVRHRTQGRRHGRGGSCDCAQDDMHFGLAESIAASPHIGEDHFSSLDASHAPTAASGPFDFDNGANPERAAGATPQPSFR